MSKFTTLQAIGELHVFTRSHSAKLAIKGRENVQDPSLRLKMCKSIMFYERKNLKILEQCSDY